MCSKLANYISQDTPQRLAVKICSWLILVLVIATTTVGVMSKISYYKDFKEITANIITSECDKPCELESCSYHCDLLVSYECHDTRMAANISLYGLDEKYSDGMKIKIEIDKTDCYIEDPNLTPLGTIFLYIMLGGILVLAAITLFVGCLLFIYKDDTSQNEQQKIEEKLLINNDKAFNYNSVDSVHIEMPHVHF